VRSNGADPHRVLGVAREATEAEIKRAYRALAKRHHPDAGQGSVTRFLEIQAAYEALIGGASAAQSAGAASARPARAPRRPAQPGDPAAANRGPGQAAGAPGTEARGPSAGPEWARRPRGGSARRPGAAPSPGGSPPGGSPPGGGAPRPPEAGRPRSDDAPRGRRGSGRRRATLGSTSYDGAEDVFEPDWGGASWYGPNSGTYWTINPKEYADPRKHGPEYQARARRPRGGAGPGGGGPEGGETGPEGGGTAPGSGATGPDPGGPDSGAGAPGAFEATADPRDPEKRTTGTGQARAPREGSGDRPASGERPGDESAGDSLPPSWRAQAWTAAAAPGAPRVAFEHDPAPDGGPWDGRPGPGAPPFAPRSPGDAPPAAPRVRQSAWVPAPDQAAPRPGVAMRVVLAVAGWLVPGLAVASLAGLPGGIVATLPLQVAGVAVLALVPRAAWVSIGGSLALVFAAIPIVALVTALGGPFVPGGPAPEAAVVLAAVAWVAGAFLVGAGRVAPYPWRAET